MTKWYLRPCPFCGHDMPIVRPLNYGSLSDEETTEPFVIECHGCGGFFHMGGDSHNLEIAPRLRKNATIRLWNGGRKCDK